MSRKSRSSIHPAAIVATVLAALLAAAPGGLADNGRKPIHQPTDIIEPGYYYLTRDITANGLPAINISLDPNQGVVIDLNCMTAEQVNDLVPVVNVGSAKSVTIKNGMLKGGSRAIQTTFVDKMELEELEMLDQRDEALSIQHIKELIAIKQTFLNPGREAIKVQNFSTLKTTGYMEDIIIKNVGAAAMDLFGLGVFALRNIQIDGAIGAGVVLDGSSNVTVEGLQTRNTGGPGFTARNLFAVEVLRAIIENAGLPGAFEFAASQNIKTQDSSTRGGAGAGLSLAGVQGGKFENLLIESPGAQGVVTDPNSSGLTFSNITARNAGGAGIEHAGDNSIFDRINLYRMPSDCHLYFPSQAELNHMTRVVARGASSCSCMGTGTTHFCDEGTGNTSQGDNYLPTVF